MRLAALALVATLGLTACGGMSAQDIAQLGLTTAWGTYQAYCSGNAQATGCSQANKAAAKQAYGLAQNGIDDWAAGTITQQEADAIIKKALKLFAQLQK